MAMGGRFYDTVFYDDLRTAPDAAERNADRLRAAGIEIDEDADFERAERQRANAEALVMTRQRDGVWVYAPLADGR